MFGIIFPIAFGVIEDKLSLSSGLEYFHFGDGVVPRLDQNVDFHAVAFPVPPHTLQFTG